MTECLLKEGVAGSAGVVADVEYAKYAYRSVASELQTMPVRNTEARGMPEGTTRVLIALYNQQRSSGRKNTTLSQIRRICEVEGIITDVDVEEIHSWITTGPRRISASDKDAMREMFC